MLRRKLFSRTPANVHAVGLAFTIVVLVAGALSAGLFTKLSGARVDIPAGLYGFSLSRYRDPTSYFRGGEHGTYAAVYYDEDLYHINRGEMSRAERKCTVVAEQLRIAEHVSS